MKEINNSLSTEDNLMTKTLAEIVKENIRSAIVFEEFGLDFCCKGNRSLKDACTDKDIETEKVVLRLNELSENGNEHIQADDWTLDFLIDYIINNHHQYVRRMMPIIALHADKVAEVHGRNHPETLQIADLFLLERKDMEMHMMKEERALFPKIKQMELMKKENDRFFQSQPGSIHDMIKMMEYEHENSGNSLSKIRELSSNYLPPEDACNTFKALYSELKEFEEDLHKHVHLENNILFPKSVSLEANLLQVRN